MDTRNFAKNWKQEMKTSISELSFSSKHISKIVIGGCLLVGTYLMMGNNNDQNWLILQYPWGNVNVIDTAGMYFKAFGKSWTYPRNWQVEYSKEHAFKVVFNDGGSATMNAMVRFSSPLTVDSKRKFHQLFGGNEEAVMEAVWAHLSDAMKSSGPVMSASEHQSARRGEFTALVQDQLQKGLFEMKRVSKTLQDQYDDKGKPITVYATEVLFDDSGHQRISRPSPLTDFGIVVTQFSITDVQYDDQTQRQFAQKKEAFLAAEGSKAQREKEVQERLMVEERGRREKAETEAAALREKARAVIQAQQQKEVEELNAARKLAVAQLTKQEAETQAQQHLQVARLAKERAKEEAETQILLAEAQAKAIEIGGAITEKEQILAKIEAEKMVNIAKELSKIQVPQFIINGGTQNSDGSVGDSLMNLLLLKQLGVLPHEK
jgi:regulator of protease activity HflC (stomatin/prohibitin superfamily)